MKSILALFIDGPWLAEEFTGPFKWALINNQGQVSSGEVEDRRRLPEANETRFVLSAPYVTTIAIENAPTDASERNLQAALPYLIEESVVDDPDRLHIVGANIDPSGRLSAFVMEKKVVEQIIKTATLNQLYPSCMTAEPLLVPMQNEEVVAVIDQNGGFIRTGKFSFHALDRWDEKSPPAVLSLIANKATLLERISIYRDPEVNAPDITTWAEKLSKEVRDGGQWRWSDGLRAASAWSINLLSGAYIRPEDIKEKKRKLFTAAGLLVAIILLSIGSIVNEWYILSNKEKQLDHEMETALVDAFPDTKRIIDPVFQMRKKLDALEAESGRGARDTAFVQSLLALTRKALQNNAHISEIEYRDSKLFVKLSLADDSDPNRVMADLEESGLKILNAKGIGKENNHQYQFDMMWKRF